MRTNLLDAAIKTLTQMTSPPFRLALLKAAGLAGLLLIGIGIGVQRLLAALLRHLGLWIESSTGPGAHALVSILEWVLAVAAGLGIVAGAVFLMPAVTALVAGLFADTIAEQVERTHYPLDPPGRPLPTGQAIIESVAAALLALFIYIVAALFLLVGGAGFLIFLLATAYVQGRIYFELAAMRFHSPEEAKELRRIHGGTVFLAGLFIAAFVSIPIVSLATPLFGTALMVHVHKRLTGIQ